MSAMQSCEEGLVFSEEGSRAKRSTRNRHAVAEHGRKSFIRRRSIEEGYS